jgi:hypothetical protein
MNQVSDLRLALAVHEAGVMPSLISSLIIGHENRVDQLHSALGEFSKLTGHANIVLHLHQADLKNPKMLKLVKHYQVSHVELFGAFDLIIDKSTIDALLCGDNSFLKVATMLNEC